MSSRFRKIRSRSRPTGWPSPSRTTRKATSTGCRRPFEALVADIVFTRAAAGDVLDPAFRAACVGTYQHGAIRHVMALDSDGQLTLSPSGQPTYRLTSYRDRTFTIEELTGFRVEFERDEAGAVDTIVFHQPNGTFVGQRASG